MAADSKPISYSIVIPVFNEEAVLPVLLRRLDLLLAQLDEPAEAIFVDDGSTDSGPFVLQALARRDPRFRYICLSRNFGHQIAITAGMDHARGDAVIVMDADLQDPPELIPEFLARWREGYEVVYGVRVRRERESLLKKLTSFLFYRLIGKIADVPRLRGALRRWKLDATIPFGESLEIDNSSLSADEAARRIAQHFALLDR